MRFREPRSAAMQECYISDTLSHDQDAKGSHTQLSTVTMKSMRDAKWLEPKCRQTLGVLGWVIKVGSHKGFDLHPSLSEASVMPSS